MRKCNRSCLLIRVTTDYTMPIIDLWFKRKGLCIFMMSLNLWDLALEKKKSETKIFCLARSWKSVGFLRCTNHNGTDKKKNLAHLYLLDNQLEMLYTVYYLQIASKEIVNIYFTSSCNKSEINNSLSSAST